MDSVANFVGLDLANAQQRLASSLVEETQDMMHELVERRRSCNLTQKNVADVIGVSRTAITHFERYDADPKMSTIVRYALAIGARLEIKVSDGISWARKEIEVEAAGRATAFQPMKTSMVVMAGRQLAAQH
ncbi:helix-turn-helix domain-containing protein [Arthrobacter sp. HLT1-20]